MHITPFGEKNLHLNTLLAISMAECLVANKILYCIVLFSSKSTRSNFLLFFHSAAFVLCKSIMQLL